jgi:SAM-dependent methyltransferase
MGPTRTCRICSGALELAHRGTAATPPPSSSFAPTNHVPGAHGDLYRCAECGTVSQPALLDGPALADRYRDMHDAGYLAEEPGRRRTARRLLGALGEPPPGGRLLEAGCGHGLLLDEARRLGWDVLGLEPAAGAAAHARDVLGLPVEEVTLADPSLDGAEFDAVALVDVLEHLEDPVGAQRRAQELLAPGGALLVVTPDPASATATLAGGRWWGFIPAHSFLIPRATLRELIAGDGLVIAADLPLVRTFTLGYWLRGLLERGGELSPAAARLARRVPDRSVSLSLGDERVVVGRRAEVQAPAVRRLTDRGSPSAVHVVLPAYNAQATVARVAAALPRDAADRALLVDDHSADATADAALAAGLEVLRHPANRGYGANQKTCYVRAALDGADVVVMVHADNQYDPALVADIVRPIEAGEADVVVGSRLLEDKAIAGGMPRWKWVGNRLLTAAENRAFRRRFSEYHTGYRAFSVDFLRTIPFLRNSDGFVFDQEIFAQLVAREARVVEIPIPTRYFLEASSVSFARSVEYGLRTLGVLLRFRADSGRSRWLLLRRPAVALGRSPAPAVAGEAPGAAGSLR